MSNKNLYPPHVYGPIKYVRDGDGIVTLTLDNPHGPVNIMDSAFEIALESVVGRLLEEVNQISGVILTSAKKTFLAGGDLNRLASYTVDHTEEQVEAFDSVKKQFRDLETLGRPVVSAINGSALGGGLEIALATHYRIAADMKGSTIGLPEIGFGLLPGGGGLTRAVYMFGLRKALYEIVLPATRFTVNQAHALGLIDEVVSTVEELRHRAIEWIRRNPAPAKAWDRPGFKLPGGLRSADELRDGIPKQLADKLLHPRFPAPAAAIAAAVEGAAVGIDAALHIESQHLIAVANGQVTKNMIHALFFDTSAVARGAQRPKKIPRCRITQVALTGSESSVAALGAALSLAGVTTRIDEPDHEDTQISIRELRPHEMTEHRYSNRGLAFRIRASRAFQTSESTQILLHAPLENSMLLQIVGAPDSDDRTIGAAYDLAAVLGKQAILTNNTPIPFGERLVQCLSNESLALMREGANLEQLHQLKAVTGFSGESETWLPPVDIGPVTKGALSLSRDAAHDAGDRLLFAAAITALTAVFEGNIGSNSEANIASFLAVGYPVWTGGAVRFATQYEGGLAGFQHRADELKRRYGERFAVSGEVLGASLYLPSLL